MFFDAKNETTIEILLLPQKFVLTDEIHYCHDGDVAYADGLAFPLRKDFFALSCSGRLRVVGLAISGLSA